jgi:hypothetical protein
MSINAVPSVFLQLRSNENIYETDLANTQDGFWMVRKSLSEILAQKGIIDFPDENGTRLACDKFYDDWFLYAVQSESDYVYSLLKLREQEHDSEGDSPADGDTPGVTVSFIAFSCEALLGCLAAPTDENRQILDCEIDRVVARRGQLHHDDLKRYFIDPKSEGTYLVADLYVKYIASFAENGVLDVPEHYREISKNRNTRLPSFIEAVNQAAGRIVCDHEKIYFQNAEELTEYERAAILATHTGNTSRYSFAAEVEYHARFLTPLAKIKIPFFKKSFYDSAVRADMTIGDAERRRSAPYYRENSKILKRQYRLHENSNGGK